MVCGHHGEVLVVHRAYAAHFKPDFARVRAEGALEVDFLLLVDFVGVDENDALNRPEAVFGQPFEAFERVFAAGRRKESARSEFHFELVGICGFAAGFAAFAFG